MKFYTYKMLMKHSLLLHERKKPETLENFINSLKINLIDMLQHRHLLSSTNHLLSCFYITVIFSF